MLPILPTDLQVDGPRKHQQLFWKDFKLSESYVELLHIRRFVCVAFYHKLQYLRSEKFESGALRGYLLGMQSCSKTIASKFLKMIFARTPHI